MIQNNLTEHQKRLHQKIKSDLGKEVIDALYDDTVIEIMLNDDNSLWIERQGQQMKKMERHTCSAQSAIHTIASYLETSITRQNPILECELPLDGSRLEAIIPPAVASPVFTIRKKATEIYTLDDYEKQGIFSISESNNYKNKEVGIPTNLSKKEVIEYAVKTKMNILIVGSTGSGKTTLTNAIIDSISKFSPNDRMILIEDTNEIQCNAKNKIILRASGNNENISLQKLVAATMRLRPNRILIGEVRNKAALDLLKAWNTGHPGGCVTVHADSARLGLLRLEQLVAEATASPMKELIGEAIDLIIYIVKTKTGRIIPEILEVRGYDSLKKEYIIKKTGEKYVE